MTFDDLITLTRNSFRDPDLAVRQLQSLDLPMSARWMALVLAVALSSFLAVLAALLFPVAVQPVIAVLSRDPFVLAAVQMAGMALAAWLIAVIGGSFGGRGDFADSLLVVVWIELLLSAVQFVQVIVMPLFPLIASLLGVAGAIAFVWLAVHLIKALHGFQSALLVLFGMVGGVMMTAVFLSVLAASLGLLPQLPPEVMNGL
ncbi:MAG: Yip1 family protein [Paracoccus sp. (in: a-proteobacteria)]|nr:Yip1 family protein [Paracoccus sp. (in: a-proteobacteria)]